jgi:hypothetical protein
MLALTQGLMSLGSGGVGPGAHRYWRILITANNGSASFFGLTEVRMFNSAAVNRIQTNTSTAPALASSQINATNRAYNAFDNSTTTSGWLSATATPPQWVRWDFQATGAAPPLAAVEVKDITIFPSHNALNASPRDFELQWSDDDISWTTALSVTNQTGWVVGTGRNFNVF